eukprot:scaffold50977_cov27-Tisochrysis_lutea.AAC.1
MIIIDTPPKTTQTPRSCRNVEEICDPPVKDTSLQFTLSCTQPHQCLHSAYSGASGAAKQYGLEMAASGVGVCASV